MPVVFARLRIAGFKSFAEPVSVEILPGLTGIVGPNGCGKSNVVEALRWAMGESSARSLRGGEMDDLIFAGTAARPARNLAEVVLTLEQAAGLAPPPFDTLDELQISRCIERGAGSAYRVNGAELRARDVQTLFADLASGARSSAMVSQGRVAAIVGARPEERRSVLEEAAGITGLHARRNEAELKLRATEANLARADDLRGQVEVSVRSLDAQATQAGRYREVASQLRDNEATLLALLHARARHAVEAAGLATQTAASALADTERRLRRAEAAEQAADAALPVPRALEADTRSLLERRRIELETEAAEGERAAQQASQAEARLEQARRDHDEAASRLADARDTRAGLMAEAASLHEAATTLPARRDTELLRLESLRSELEAAEQAAHRASAALASVHTRHAEAARDQAAAGSRLQRADATRAELETVQAQAQAALPAPELLASHEAACAGAAQQASATAAALEAATEARGTTARMADAARNAATEQRRRHEEASRRLEAAEAHAVRLAAELRTLEARWAAAAAALVPEPEQHEAAEASRRAEAAHDAATAALERAEGSRADAMAARLEAASRLHDAGRQRSQLASACVRAESAWHRAVSQHETLTRDHAQALADRVAPERMEGARQARMQATAALDDAQARLAKADRTHEIATGAATHATAELAQRRDVRHRLHAEADGLAQALAHEPDGGDAARLRVADMIEVPPGLEAALASCLGDGLDAACDPAAPHAWLALPPVEPAPLPPGAEALEALVAAPAVLSRALSQIGLVAGVLQGDALHATLRPGQCLVTRDGALWRWDGYRVAPGLPGQAATRRQQRARLRDTRARLAEADAAIMPAQLENARLATLRDQADAAARAARSARTPLEQALAQAREAENLVRRQDDESRARLEALTPQHDQAARARTEADAALSSARAALADLPDADMLSIAHQAACRSEADSVAAEDLCRTIRRQAQTALSQARETASIRLARHAEGLSAQAMLTPLLARTRNEAAASATTRQAAHDAIAELSPDAAEAALAQASSRSAASLQAEQAARTSMQVARREHAARVGAREAVAASLLEGRSRLEVLEAALAGARSEQDAAGQAVQALDAASASLPDPEQASAAAMAAADALVAARASERSASELVSRLLSEQAALEARRAPLAASVSDWNARHAAASTSLDAATLRLDQARAEQALHRQGPAEAARRRAARESARDTAEAEHGAARLALDQAEAAGQAAQQDRRRLETELGAAREAALRAQARSEQAHAILAQLLAGTPEPPTLVPDDLSNAAETALRRRLARLVRERDAIGPVNLRAELELRAAEAQAAAILCEQEELQGAIARLRGQIGHLNREGRERLMTVFEQVDRHFRALFARMFDGGRAQLGMVGSDDPLSAGLEIYAQPPGKKLATLSLLSGGEQALTALSLIFAVFRCNPAPVCVLDEVDAPLDDANVERFCALLADMVHDAGTRFLVVTHHQLTMAHMDRLYGVTMQERGVSRVLSVDLAHATEMVG